MGLLSFYYLGFENVKDEKLHACRGVAYNSVYVAVAAKHSKSKYKPVLFQTRYICTVAGNVYM
jgi:hypothetical protein